MYVALKMVSDRPKHFAIVRYQNHILLMCSLLKKLIVLNWVLKHNGMPSIKITYIHQQTRSLHPATRLHHATTRKTTKSTQTFSCAVVLICLMALVRRGQTDTGTHNFSSISGNRSRVPESSLPQMRIKAYVSTQNVQYWSSSLHGFLPCPPLWFVYEY